jgi:hypothetical protein
MNSQDAQFLPGPWCLGRRPPGDRYQPVCNARGIVVAEVSGVYDARLIAAAPEMYELLCALDRPEVEAGLDTMIGTADRKDIMYKLRRIRDLVEGKKINYREDLPI